MTEKKIGDIGTTETDAPEGEPEEIGVSTGGIGDLDLVEILTRPTGPGEIEEYIDHPLNFNHSRGLAQVIRGLVGLLGSLDYWIVDVVIGLVRTVLQWDSE